MKVFRLISGLLLSSALMASCAGNCGKTTGKECEGNKCEKACCNKNQTLEVIKTRRSCRVFNPDSMPNKEVLSKIAEAGTWAPTGMGTQNPIILVITKKDMRDKIMKMNAKIMGKEDMDPFYGAPCIMIVLSKKEGTTIYDGTCVMTTLMLAAKSLGVESCWIHRAKEEFESEEGKAILKELGIEGQYEGIGHVALGYAKGEIPTPKPRKADYIHWIE